MQTISFRVIAFLVAGLIAPALFSSNTVLAETGYTVRQVKGTYDDVLQDLKDAIVNRGLVIDYTGHVHDMLVRTGEATGGKSPYKAAHYMQFCSAKLSLAAFSADPANLAICPFVVFAYERADRPGTIFVGHRRPIGTSSRTTKKAIGEIEKLLGAIIAEAGK